MVKEPPKSGGQGGEGVLAGKRGTGEKGEKQGWEIGKEEVEGDGLLSTGVRGWELKEPRGNLTLTRGAYRPYST